MLQPTYFIPGLVLASLLALIAMALAVILPVPAVLIGLILGILMNSASASFVFAPGLTFGGRSVLRLGVALLGAQVTVSQIIDLGPAPLVIALGSLAMTLAIGVVVARSFDLDRPAAMLTASAVAICGASAALAVAAVMPRGRLPDHMVATTVGMITIIGSLAMVAYPFIAAEIGFNAEQAGILFGASLHEVVQAVGAGFTHSERAGEVAAMVKLARVACLAPIVMSIAWWVRRRSNARDATPPPLVPAFLLGFLAFAGVASVGGIPPAIGAILRDLSRFCLLIGVVALGTKISPRQILAVDGALALSIIVQSILIAVIAFTGVALLTSS